MAGWHHEGCFKEKLCLICETPFVPKSGAGRFCSDKCVKTSNAENSIKHRNKKQGLYHIWWNMLQRCYNENTDSYNNYGKRGIKVCKRWHVFENFYKDVFPRPEKYQLDRKRVNEDYSPANCQWVSSKANGQNKRNNKLLTFKGFTKCVSWWAEKLNVTPSTIRWRIKKGWPLEKILTQEKSNCGPKT